MIPSPAPFRKKSNWLAALLVEAMAPAFRHYADRRCGTAVLPPKDWRRALILGDNHIGDLLYRTCSLHNLKEGLPECDLYYLAAESTAGILHGNPCLKAVLPWALSDSQLDLTPEHFSALRDLRFDAALCTNCIRYWPELLLAIRLGIPNRAGYTYKGFSGWVTHPVPLRYPQAYPFYFRDYVTTLTGRTAEGPLKPRVFISHAAEMEAEEAMRGLGYGTAERVIAFFLTTRQNTALWPVDRYLKLFDLVSNRPGVKIVLMGAKADSRFLNTVSSSSPLRPAVCAGALSLQGLAAFLKKCALVVTTDSGPRHIANAVDTKVLFFRNSASSVIETGPYCDNEADLLQSGEFLSLSGQSALLLRVDPADIALRIKNALGLESQ